MPDADLQLETSDRRVIGGRTPDNGSAGPAAPSVERHVIGDRRSEPETIRAVAPASLLERVASEPQRAFPAIAKDAEACGRLADAVHSLPTSHVLYNMDSRQIDIEPGSVSLVVTSPPYWTLKKYNDHEHQLGSIANYDEFLDELDRVWRMAYDALVPGGRMVIVTGDVNVSRKVFGRHLVFPLHASIQERCRRIGFDNLAPIIWHKIANAQYEMGAGGFFGKPYEPNGIIKNDIEYILFERKGGGYRSPDLATRLMSIIPAGDHAEWFRQVWCLGGASTRDHPAPFPVALAERLIRMFSFAGDTVLDPFLGTGTTSVAAARCGRNSIGSEIDPEYFSLCIDRVRASLAPASQTALDLSV